MTQDEGLEKNFIESFDRAHTLLIFLDAFKSFDAWECLKFKELIEVLLGSLTNLTLRLIGKLVKMDGAAVKKSFPRALKTWLRYQKKSWNFLLTLLNVEIFIFKAI